MCLEARAEQESRRAAHLELQLKEASGRIRELERELMLARDVEGDSTAGEASEGCEGANTPEPAEGFSCTDEVPLSDRGDPVSELLRRVMEDKEFEEALRGDSYARAAWEDVMANPLQCIK